MLTAFASKSSCANSRSSTCDRLPGDAVLPSFHRVWLRLPVAPVSGSQISTRIWRVVRHSRRNAFANVMLTDTDGRPPSFARLLPRYLSTLCVLYTWSAIRSASGPCALK